jgi:hypothetical protein
MTMNYFKHGVISSVRVYVLSLARRSTVACGQSVPRLCAELKRVRTQFAQGGSELAISDIHES